MKRLLLGLSIILCPLSFSFAQQSAFKGVWPVTDKSVMKSLNGDWLLKVVKGIDDDRTVPPAIFTWKTIHVPECWETYGYCEPRYSFPDSLTGYYRTSFTLPREWKGQRVIIRLDGVLRGYDLWLNDQLVGTWEQAYNTCLFDLTPYLTRWAFEGESQQLAMRVYSRFKGFEFDCFDDWAPMGIFRDVTLMAVPKIHLSDLTVTTKMNGEVTVKTEVANATKHTTTSFEILDADGTVVSTGGMIEQPMLWTAETPYLYTLRVHVKEKGKILQTFTQKIGIREISIDGNILKLNGQPIKLRGVNAHSTDPVTVKVISDELTLKDMHMMKEASINYMRLSHYPREPRFYELADSLGFYLVDEVPFGFGDKHLSNRSYQDILMTRAQATVQRDKNHPSVIVWSVGNENPLPQTCIEVGDYVGQLDPSRPYCFPQVGSYFRRFWEKATVATGTAGSTGTTGTTGASGAAANSSLFTLHSSLKSPFPSSAPVYAPHYPTTGQIGSFYQTLDRPLIFTEYCHTLGISFEDHDRQWEIIERTPGIAGGSVWEWADQGMPIGMRNENQRSTAEGEVKGGMRNGKVYGYEERVLYSPLSSEGDGGRLGFEMYGNKGTDGLAYADRTPLPNYYELQHNYARAFVSSLCCDAVAANMTVVNRYDFLNLKDNVTFHWALTNDRDTVARGSFSPDCPPRSSVSFTLHPSGEADSSLFTLHSSLNTLHFTIEDKDGHTFLHQSFVLNKPALSYLAPQSSPLASPASYLDLIQETTVRAGRKATLAERITQRGRLPQKYLLPMENNQVKADIQRKPVSGGEEVSFILTPDTADVFRAELGIAYLLAPSIDRVQWIGQGPFASYPGRHQACRYGIWAKHMDDLYFEGNHMGVDAALFTDSLGNGILVTAPLQLEGQGEALNLNFEQTDRGIVVTVNAAVSGQGPKFAKTAFNGWKPGDGPVSASFRIYRVESGQTPSLFIAPHDVPAPFHPFATQYDTYLLKYNNIKSAE